ncbi:hypothetical protein Tco_0333328 [Tanacetum coccineum]
MGGVRGGAGGRKRWNFLAQLQRAYYFSIPDSGNGDMMLYAQSLTAHGLVAGIELPFCCFRVRLDEENATFFVVRFGNGVLPCAMIYHVFVNTTFEHARLSRSGERSWISALGRNYCTLEVSLLVSEMFYSHWKRDPNEGSYQISAWYQQPLLELAVLMVP